MPKKIIYQIPEHGPIVEYKKLKTLVYTSCVFVNDTKTYTQNLKAFRF